MLSIYNGSNYNTDIDKLKLVKEAKSDSPIQTIGPNGLYP